MSLVNEWVSRLMNVMTPNIVDGFKAIFTDSYTFVYRE